MLILKVAGFLRSNAETFWISCKLFWICIWVLFRLDGSPTECPSVMCDVLLLNCPNHVYLFFEVCYLYNSLWFLSCAWRWICLVFSSSGDFSVWSKWEMPLPQSWKQCSMSSVLMFVCPPQDLSSFAMPFLEGDAEHASKDGVRKVIQPKACTDFVQVWN